jgi:PAS domain S-box-containing protein/putative nucleotidyltransferase with HDIG domain
MSQARILIVEDEPVVALNVKKRLQCLGYEETQVVASGEEAVLSTQEARPDIILMDIMLQGQLDGIEAALRIREQYNIPVIYLTAFADQDILNRAKITEPFGYILKPFEDRELQTCIEMALYKHAMELKLLENERWHSTTLKSIGDAVISTDNKGLIRVFNPVAEQLTGLSSKLVLNKPFSETVHLLSEEDGQPVEDVVGLALERQLWDNDTPLLLEAADGKRRPVDITISTIDGPHSRISGAVLIIRDISDARKAEEELRQSLRTLRRTLEETVTALAMTTEKRDPYTAGHQQRVAKLASAIAAKLDLAEERIEGLRVAALLHDLGKIYIPAEILSKPARLTDMEMGIMKTHSEVGYDILKGVSFPWPVADIVLQHHERIDGSGYPRGLMDQDILLDAKIIMVADVVEAMSSHRPYRAALGLQLALEEIEMNKGKRYQRDIVDACLDLFINDGFGFEE